VEYEIGADETVSTAVVRAVGAVEGRKPQSLQPLTNVINTEALDTLFACQCDGTPRIGGRLSFIYSTCRITIDNGEYLTLQLLETRLYDTSGTEEESRSVG
jgi:hypothetical protein